MSIIHDALKKVQKDLDAKNNEYLYAAQPPVEVLPGVEKLNSRSQGSLGKTLLITVSILLVLAALAGAAWYVYEHNADNSPLKKNIVKAVYKIIRDNPALAPPPVKSKPLAQITINAPAANAVRASSNVASSVASAPGAVPVSSVPAPVPAPDVLDVQGIMANTTGNVALINGQVYQEGDTVNGTKILKIDLKYITVLTNQKEETIYVKN